MHHIIANDSHTRARATQILDQYIQGARQRSERGIGRIMSEIPQDSIVRGAGLGFQNVEGHLMMTMGQDPKRSYIHDNALTQIASRAGIPITYVRHLQEQKQPWAADLLASTFDVHAKQALTSDRLLVREHNGTVRGVLSDHFRRIDCRPGFDALIGEAQKAGALVSDATVTDTRSSVKLIIPKIIELTPGEFVVFGVEWSNSDYGKGPQSLALFALRVWCLNGATLSQELRQIHLGGRLPENIQWSERTMRLDSAATASAIRDTARGLLSPARMDATAEMIRNAASTEVDAKLKIGDIRKRLGKTIADSVAQAYNMADVEALPPGNTAWRWSNAISWVAKQEGTDAETRLDLEKEAGAALAVKA